MNWETIYSNQRSEKEIKNDGLRSEYQIDFDRLIFSSGFRRLQNKTQVFPLPGSTFVHNRLTHSLEVASVGRSLGKIIGMEIAKRNHFHEDADNFYKHELANVIAAACLAHDIGNPAFGHSGEKAISNFFLEAQNEVIDGKPLKAYFDRNEWTDLINFEGNANALRILTHQFKGKAEGGLRLTYTTLAAILKYPCESIACDKKYKHRKKYGFFQAEKDTFLRVAKALNMVQEEENPVSFKRHPFVYLTEAADDICYRVIDLEDAQRLGILGTKEVEELLLNLLSSLGNNDVGKIVTNVSRIGDRNEKIGYLRAVSINALIHQSTSLFFDNYHAIQEGSYNDTLLDYLQDNCTALKEIQTISVEEIYNHETVVEIEIAGYNVMYDLLKLMIPAALKNNPSDRERKVLRLLPKQFSFDLDATSYHRVLSVVDFISGMTDSYATELYRKVFGIEVPKHR